ncbi:MAG: hypothetical protein MI923_16230 [Phycisphaerales bacterium]|nr:hypothetical protein [Phycisphaerales bacterium]
MSTHRILEICSACEHSDSQTLRCELLKNVRLQVLGRIGKPFCPIHRHKAFIVPYALKGAVKRTKAALHLEQAPAEIIEHRRMICRSCEHNVSGKCDLCGCPVGPKTSLAAERCPDEPTRWLSVARGKPSGCGACGAR